MFTQSPSGKNDFTEVALTSKTGVIFKAFPTIKECSV
jgi:hypothetical protein